MVVLKNIYGGQHCPSFSFEVVRMNEHNLTPFTSAQSREEAVKNGAKGGVKSGEARRRKAAMKTTMRQLLSLPVLDADTWNALAALGVEPDQMDNQTALLAAVLVKGIRTGDFRTMQAVLAVIGEDNDTERLKLQKKQAAALEKSKNDDGVLAEIIEALKSDN